MLFKACLLSLTKTTLKIFYLYLIYVIKLLNFAYGYLNKNKLNFFRLFLYYSFIL